MYEIKNPININSLFVYSIFFGGLENVATKKLVTYFKTQSIENTKTKV